MSKEIQASVNYSKRNNSNIQDKSAQKAHPTRRQQKGQDSLSVFA